MKFRLDDMFTISGVQLMVLVHLTSYNKTAMEIVDAVTRGASDDTERNKKGGE